MQRTRRQLAIAIGLGMLALQPFTEVWWPVVQVIAGLIFGLNLIALLVARVSPVHFARMVYAISALTGLFVLLSILRLPFATADRISWGIVQFVVGLNLLLTGIYGIAPSRRESGSPVERMLEKLHPMALRWVADWEQPLRPALADSHAPD